MQFTETKTGKLGLEKSNPNLHRAFFESHKSWRESWVRSIIYIIFNIKSLGAVLITNWAWCQRTESALRFAVADFIIKIEIHTAQTGFLRKNITVSSRYTCRAPKTGAGWLLWIPTRTSMPCTHRGHRVIINGAQMKISTLYIHEPLNNSQRQPRACKWNESNEQSSGKKSAYSLVDSSLPQWAIDKNKRATTALLSFWSINVSDQWCKGLILIFIRLLQVEYGHENVKCGSKTD